ncbi:class I adenylate-forming enzyme family protein [Planctomycetota bacterium]|nr:class I adenylate-forming enzyme family protein [Planctomycetota bacterium]
MAKKASGKKAAPKKAAVKRKPAKKKAVVKKAAAVKKAAPKKKATAKKKTPVAKKATPKKTASKKPAPKKKSVAKKMPAAKITGKVGKQAYEFEAPSKRTGSLVRARFTDPLRNFSSHENIGQLIDAQASTYGDRTFLYFDDDGREFSFQEVQSQTLAVSSVLRNIDTEVGSRVAVLMRNSPSLVVTLLGVMRSGRVCVPLHMGTDPDLVRLELEDSGASVLFIDSSMLTLVREFLGELPGIEHVIVKTTGDEVGDILGEYAEDLKERFTFLDYDSAIEQVEIGEDDHQCRWWDEAQIAYTGTTTGNPRGAILQHRQFITAARWLAVSMGLNESDCIQTVLPLFHTSAQVLGLLVPLQLGATAVLSSRFNVNRLWKSVERYKVTTIGAVPSMLGILTDREKSEAPTGVSPKDLPWPSAHESIGTWRQSFDDDARDSGLARAHDIRSLKRMVCGASPLHRAVQLAFEKCFLVPVLEGYCCTETTAFAALNPSDGSRKVGSVGHALGNKMAIQNEDMAPKPLAQDWKPTSLARMNPMIFPTAGVGQTGEICVWGENVLKEYFRRPSQNPEAFAGGWFHSGDVGYQDQDEFIYVLGDKQQVLSSGARITPRKIDEVLAHHPDVDQVYSMATDGRKQARVTTFVVLREGFFPDGVENGRLPKDINQSRATATVLQSFVKSRVDQDTEPDAIVFTRSIPQSSTGRTRILQLKRMVEGFGEDE